MVLIPLNTKVTNYGTSWTLGLKFEDFSLEDFKETYSVMDWCTMYTVQLHNVF